MKERSGWVKFNAATDEMISSKTPKFKRGPAIELKGSHGLESY